MTAWVPRFVRLSIVLAAALLLHFATDAAGPQPVAHRAAREAAGEEAREKTRTIRPPFRLEEMRAILPAAASVSQSAGVRYQASVNGVGAVAARPAMAERNASASGSVAARNSTQPIIP